MATKWLAEAISSHPKMLCTHGLPEEWIKSQKSSLCDHMNSMAAKVDGVAGSIHGSGAHGTRLYKELQSHGGVFVGLLRDPTVRTSSQFTEKSKWHRSPQETKAQADYLAASAPLLWEILYPEIGSTTDAALLRANVEFATAAYKTFLFDAQLMRELPGDRIFKFEDYTQNLQIFHSLLETICRGFVDLSNDYIFSAFQRSAINKHHETLPPSGQEVFAQWDGDKKNIFLNTCLYFDNLTDISSLYREFDYHLPSTK